jgi:hypothetical protein
MRVYRRSWGSVAGLIFSLLGTGLLLATVAYGQASYTAQVRGVVTDQSGALVANATVTITNDSTNIAQTAHSDEHGQYFLAGLRPSVYTIKAQAAGFQIAEKKNVVLQVDQQTSVDFVLRPHGISETIEVTQAAPLLDTESPTLGTEITNEYVKEIPLINRNFFGLMFLSGGVTEVAGSGTQDNYPTGTNFVSNGQRNATAEVRIDGALISAPEQGEGATSNVYYEPSVEIVQEFKVQNNSFSAEFGNNGGTVVNMVLKSGTNKFHGSGWYFLQRAGTDARNFFNPEPNPKPAHKRDQGGFSLGGPIKKNKTFFFADFEKVRDDEPINFLASVPTLAERNGDFRNNGNPTNPIYDPSAAACPNPCTQRPQVQYNGQLNVIPPGEIDPIGQGILSLYPKPNVPTAGEFNNFLFNTLSHGPTYQFDIKLDHQVNDKRRINGRYSRAHSNFYSAEFMGDGEFGDGYASSPTTTQNGSLEYTWTINPRTIWTSHFAVDRVKAPTTTNIPTIESFNATLPAGVPGLPTTLEANGVNRMPTIQISGALPWSSLFDQCCVNTNFAHTLYSYSSQLVISKGAHLMKIGGEQRLFYNNFWQPPNPTGNFNFTDFVTSPSPNSDTDASGNPTGNPFASVMFGYADNVQGSSLINVYPAVANRSKETGFYFQDDWKVNSKLTLNLGIRYEWSTPYTERFNRIQFSDFKADTGVAISLADSTYGQSAQSAMLGIANLSSSEELLGTTAFASSGNRSVPVYRKDVGPRLGFAYQVTPTTVVRGGAGMYFGMSVATNFQYPGTAFRESPTFFFTTNNFQSQQATLEDPFFGTPLTPPQGTQYGKLAEWGYGNGNDLGTTAARDADIYQWNLGVQHLFPSQIVIGVDYSANRSTHLPWGGYSSTRNRDYIPSALLSQISAAEHPTDPTCDADSCVSNFLQTQVNNPFYNMFSGPNAIFNQPSSLYSAPNTNGSIPLIYMLRPNPQFTGDFEGLPLLEASSWYNSMQVRFQKRTTHHVSFEGSYTVSKLTDYSSVGANAFVGTLNAGNPQQLDNLKAEHGISANDTPQRLAGAFVVELPIGREKWIGGNMNRAVDAVVGGWSFATLLTEQSGQPMAIAMASARLADGNQRPNVACPQVRTGLSSHTVALNWQNVGNQASPPAFFNINCFADPGDQMPGNAPRYFPGLRADGIHNVDLNFYKEFVPKEGMRLELRAEIFNLANHARFGPPDTAFVPGENPQIFGTITGTAAGYTPRRFQFGVRFEF